MRDIEAALFRVQAANERRRKVQKKPGVDTRSLTCLDQPLLKSHKAISLFCPIPGIASAICGRFAKRFDSQPRCDMHVFQYRNTILSRLPDGTIAPACPCTVRFAVNDEIEYPSNPIRNLIFLEEGMASMTTTFEDGTQVEGGMHRARRAR